MGLQAQLDQKERELSLLYRINDTIATSLHLQGVLDETISVVTDLTGCDSSLIYLLDFNRKEITLVASQHPRPDFLGKINLSMGEGIAGWVAQNKTPVVVEKKAYEDARFKFFSNSPKNEFESFISFPISFQDKIVGVINIFHREEHHCSESTLRLLRVLSQQVGGIIERTNVYDRFVRKYDEVQAIGKIVD